MSKCRSCDCNKEEHDSYWFCPHLSGDICDICCKYDSLDPSWNWIECLSCNHRYDRHETLDMNKDFVIFQEDGKIWKAINIPRDMHPDDVPDPEELCEATEENLKKWKAKDA